MGRIDEDGWLYFAGRGKDTIRRRGENISCYELETILSSYGCILECAAIPVPSELGEDEIKVVLVPREGETVDFGDAIRFCEENMPKFMVPRYIDFLPELPKNAVHRILKTELKKIGVTEKTYDREKAGYKLKR